MDSRSPDGSGEFDHNGGPENHIAHWDTTFSAPKFTGVRYGFGSERIQNKVIEAHNFAVNAVLDFMKTHTAQTRRGQPAE